MTLGALIGFTMLPTSVLDGYKDVVTWHVEGNSQCDCDGFRVYGMVYKRNHLTPCTNTVKYSFKSVRLW